MSSEFKPLWRVHNRVYRQYAKGIAVKQFRKYIKKVFKVLRLKK